MQRLTTRPQFEAVLAGGRTVARTTHFALHRLDFTAAPPAAADAPASAAVSPLGAFGRRTGSAWLGVVIPKRWAKRAVTRNTIRRQIYAVAAEHAGWPPAAHVVRLKGAFDRKLFPSATSDALKAAVRGELQQLVGRALGQPAAAAAASAA